MCKSNNAIYQLIQDELERAIAIHPDYPSDIFKQLAIMQEEAGEVAKAVNDYSDGKDSIEHIKEELIQTSAMCVRMMLNIEKDSTCLIKDTTEKQNNKNSLCFRVDTMGLLTEIADAGLDRNMGVLKIPLNIFKNLLGEVAQRATILNDPELNILMLRLALYDVKQVDIYKAIEIQKTRIK